MLALQVLCGEEMAMEFSQQADLIHSLSDVAMLVKGAKDQQRQTTLVHQLQRLASSLNPTFRLPINPALQCCDIDIENCSFFNSKTVPLKLSFKNVDPFGTNIDIMFKAGDDLRQDMLAQQLIKLMDKIWLRAGLDLRLITYQVLSTGDEQGLVELVKDSSTLRQIQTEHGLTGSFKDKPLSEWLLRHNSSDVAWKQATENFTHSCAGYCVATYVLGICDRHNDNIMVSKSGHMFHIDFGRILGNAQMFGAIKRDRAPFVLTPDMAYVINAGDKPSVQFQKFTDLCCVAFNELRKHSHLFLTSLSLLLSSGIPELSSVDDIMYVRNNLLPNSTDEEATHYFTKNIEASLGTIATQINFFIHNLAQFKFSSSPASQGLLSFSPSSYSIATDGKVEQATVVAYYMRYYPEKFIVSTFVMSICLLECIQIYQIQVVRADPVHQDTIIFRRYSEFHELHSKLAECFPNESNLPQLPRKKYMPGQSYSREVSSIWPIQLLLIWFT
jgi:phosphatidylinositol-4-phosphate 3-kinase